MSKLYVPVINNQNCVVVYDKDTIRVFDSVPTINNEVSFTDYFINSHYVSKNDNITFLTQEELPTCLNNNNDVTTDFYYRNDIADILLVFFIILIVCIYFPLKIISRMFGRWLKI